MEQQSNQREEHPGGTPAGPRTTRRQAVAAGAAAGLGLAVAGSAAGGVAKSTRRARVGKAMGGPSGWPGSQRYQYPRQLGSGPRGRRGEGAAGVPEAGPARRRPVPGLDRQLHDAVPQGRDAAGAALGGAHRHQDQVRAGRRRSGVCQEHPHGCDAGRLDEHRPARHGGHRRPRRGRPAPSSGRLRRQAQAGLEREEVGLPGRPDDDPDVQLLQRQALRGRLRRRLPDVRDPEGPLGEPEGEGGLQGQVRLRARAAEDVGPAA